MGLEVKGTKVEGVIVSDTAAAAAAAVLTWNAPATMRAVATSASTANILTLQKTFAAGYHREILFMSIVSGLKVSLNSR